MKRNFKTLGLAFVAALAMSAVAAGSAQAEAQGFFTADAYPAVATGFETKETGADYFQVTGAAGPKTHCDSVSYEATLGGQSTSLTVTPHYTNCEATDTPIGDVAASVDLNGCDYLFEAGTTTTNGITHGSVAIQCPMGQPGIQVTVGGVCEVNVPPQTINGGVTFENVANGDVTVNVNIVEKITYQETDLSFFCPNGNVHRSDGTFISTVTVKGFKDAKKDHSVITKDSDGVEWPKNEYTHEGDTNIAVE